MKGELIMLDKVDRTKMLLYLMKKFYKKRDKIKNLEFKINEHKYELSKLERLLKEQGVKFVDGNPIIE